MLGRFETASPKWNIDWGLFPKLLLYKFNSRYFKLIIYLKFKARNFKLCSFSPRLFYHRYNYKFISFC